MTLDDLIAEMRPFHNHACVVHDTDIGRLVGIGEDESDYYYIIRSARYPDGREWWATAVGGCESLKPMPNYERISEVLSLNGAGPSDEFKVIPYDRTG